MKEDYLSEDNLVITLGKRMRDLRKSRGYTQKQLADALNVSFSVIGNWEIGRTPIPTDKALAFCNLLNIDHKSFFNYDPSILSPQEQFNELLKLFDEDDIYNSYYELPPRGKQFIQECINLYRDSLELRRNNFYKLQKKESNKYKQSDERESKKDFLLAAHGTHQNMSEEDNEKLNEDLEIIANYKKKH